MLFVLTQWLSSLCRVGPFPYGAQIIARRHEGGMKSGNKIQLLSATYFMTGSDAGAGQINCRCVAIGERRNGFPSRSTRHHHDVTDYPPNSTSRGSWKMKKGFSDGSALASSSRASCSLDSVTCRAAMLAVTCSARLACFVLRDRLSKVSYAGSFGHSS